MTAQVPPDEDDDAPTPCLDMPTIKAADKAAGCKHYITDKACRSWWLNLSLYSGGPGTCHMAIRQADSKWGDKAMAMARRCMTPDRSSGRPAFFNLGDSHASSIELGLSRALQGRMELAGVQRGDCVWGTSAIRTCDSADHANVGPYFAAVTALLEEQLRPGDVVSLLGREDEHLSTASLEWYNRSVIPMLAARGATFLLLGDYPGIKTVCSGSNAASLASCVNGEANALSQRSVDGRTKNPVTRGDLSGTAAAFAASHEGVRFMSLAPFFCSSPFSADSKCTTFLPGTTVMAHMDDHINRAGAMYLWPFFCSIFRGWGFFD